MSNDFQHWLSSKRFSRTWRRGTSNQRTSRNRSSSCQCSMTLCGKQMIRIAFFTLEKVKDYAKKFLPGHWTFLGPGSEMGWYGLSSKVPLSESWNLESKKKGNVQFTSMEILGTRNFCFKQFVLSICSLSTELWRVGAIKSVWQMKRKNELIFRWRIGSPPWWNQKKWKCWYLHPKFALGNWKEYTSYYRKLATETVQIQHEHQHEHWGQAWDKTHQQQVQWHEHEHAQDAHHLSMNASAHLVTLFDVGSHAPRGSSSESRHVIHVHVRLSLSSPLSLSTSICPSPSSPTSSFSCTSSSTLSSTTWSPCKTCAPPRTRGVTTPTTSPPPSQKQDAAKRELLKPEDTSYVVISRETERFVNEIRDQVE